MADVPTTDLVTVWADGDTGWTELSGRTFGSAPSVDTENYIQGTDAVTQQVSTNKTGLQSGMEYDFGSDITAFTDSSDCFFIWWQFLYSQALNDYDDADTTTGAGFYLGVGSTSGNTNFWAVGGADFGRNPYGGWYNTAIDPTQTPQVTDGSPASSQYRIFGFLPGIATAPSKGQANCGDVIRYGRGQILLKGSAPDGTFDSVAEANDSNNARWGLFSSQGGGFLYKGLLSFGDASNSCAFTDADKQITIDDTRKVYEDFNRIEFSNTSSNINWTNITINKTRYIPTLPFISRGRMVMVDSCTLNFSGCSFTDMDRFIFKGSGADITDTTFRRTNYVYARDGVTFTECTWENSTDSDAALVLFDSSGEDLSLVTNCSFTADSSSHGHAVRIQDPIVGNISRTWDGNTLTGYAPGSTGTTVGVSGTDSDAIEVNVGTGSTLTLSVVNGATIPSVQNLGAGTVIVTAAVSVTLSGLLGNSEVQVLENPSPYTDSAGGASPTTINSIETVAAVTGTDISYSTSGPNVTSINSSSTNLSSITGLTSGDFIRVTDRSNLLAYDTFEVLSVLPTSIDVVDDTYTLTQLTTAGENVTVEKVDAEWSFSTSAGQALDILVFRVGSEPEYILNFEASDTTIPVQQSDDRNYENP